MISYTFLFQQQARCLLHRLPSDILFPTDFIHRELQTNLRITLDTTEEKSSGIFKNILTKIIRQNSFLPKALDKIDVIIDYIQNHYGEEITNQTLGELISYHPYYINRLMRNTTGTTLHQYLLNFRIDVAKRLLITSEISISDIVTQCGFKIFSYFSNCFKAKTGYTPLLFRKKDCYL